MVQVSPTIFVTLVSLLRHFDKLFLKVFLVASVVASIGCGSSKGDGSTGAEGARPVAVETARVIAGPGVGDLAVPSVLRPKADVRVRAKSGGEVVIVEITEGARVEMGETLALLENDEEKFGLQIAEAELDLRKIELDRSKELHAKGTISEQEFEQARFELRSAEARWERARFDLSRRTVTSPIDGLVMERWIDPGETVEEGDELFRIVEPSILRADLYVPEEERSWIHEGTTALLVAGGRQEEIEVTRVIPVIDPSSGTFKVTVLLANDRETWTPGTSCEFIFRRDSGERVLTLPEGIFVEREGGATSVYVIENDRARRRTVRLGSAEGARLRVLEGLDEGEEVVFRTHGRLKDETPVSIDDGQPSDHAQ